MIASRLRASVRRRAPLLGWLQGAGLALFPWVAVLLGLVNAPGVDARRPWRGWLWVWSSLLALGLLMAFIRPSRGLPLLGEAVVGLVASVILRPFRSAWLGMLAGLAILGAVGMVQQASRALSWYALGATSLSSPSLLPGDRAYQATIHPSSGVTSSWVIPVGVTRIRVAVPGEAVGGEAGGDAGVSMHVVAWWPDPSLGWSRYPTADLRFSRTWSAPTVALELPPDHPERTAVVLRTASPGDVTLRLRGPSVTAAESGAHLRSAQSMRSQLLAPGPNLAAHSAVAVALAVAATAQPLAGVVVAFVLGLALAWVTGSRAAWLGMALGSVLAVLVLRRRFARSRVGAAAVVLAAVLLALASLGLLSRRGPGLESTVQRTQIWRFAAHEFALHPLTGLSGAGTSFASAWAAQKGAPDALPVDHAHDLWLQFAAEYGLAGVVAILAFTVALVRWAWRLRGWYGLVVLVPILAMNVVDYTLLYSGVLFPLLLGLNSGAGPEPGS